MTRYVLSEDGSLCAPNDATEDCKSLMDWAHEFDAMRNRIAALEAQLDAAERALRWFVLQGKSAYYMSPEVFMSHGPAELQLYIRAALAPAEPAKDQGDEHG